MKPQVISSVVKRFVPPLLAFAIVVVLVEMLCQKGILPSYLFPAPSNIFKIMQSEAPMLLSALLDTVQASLIGLLLSILIGFTLGTLSYFWPLFGSVLTPYTVLFQTVPIVALAPLLVIWLGFGIKSVIASSFIVSVFPMISGSFLGFRSVEKSYLDLFFIHRARASHLFFKLLLPSSLPYFFQSLKISAGLSVIGAIVGEFMSGTGLGSVIEVSRVQFRIDLMFAAILLSSIYGLSLLLMCNFSSFYFLRHWHSSEQSKK